MAVTEITEPDVDILEGYVGNLSEEQEDKLRQMWDGYFDWCAKASGNSKGGTATFDDDAEQDPKKAGIPKGDAAKEEAKKKEEQAGLDALLKTYGPDSLKRALWEFIKMDNPDGIFLRFLRARKWDVTRALGMFASCLKWRLDNNVEELVHGGDEGNGSIEKFLEQQRSGKTYALGTAVNEQPICYIHVKKHLTFGQPGSSMQKYVIYAMESFRLLMMPPGDKVILFFDLTGFGLKNMDWNCILFIVKCLEAFYPESLGILYIHNAPWIFTGIWKILGPLLDPVVRSKVAFTKNAKDVEDRVPAERLIADLGGECVTGFKFMEPEQAENDQLNDEAGKKKAEENYKTLADEYEDATRKWIKTKGKDDEATKKREILVKKLRIAQFELEPFIRGRTVYHRNGTIDGQGKVTWEYKQKNDDIIRHVAGRKTCVATYKREIKEMEEGASAHEVEAKSDKAVKERDWMALYGDEETVRRLEGDDAVKSGGQGQGQSQANGKPAQQSQQNGSAKHEHEAEAAGAGAAAGAAAGAGAAAASSRRSRRDREDAPEQDQEQAAPKQQAREAAQNAGNDPDDSEAKSKAKKATAAVGGAAASVGGAFKKLNPKKKNTSDGDASAPAQQNNGQAAAAAPAKKSRGTGKSFVAKGPEDAEEVEQDEVDIPDGAPGKLTDDQKDKLREMWNGYFEWCAKASGNAQGGSGNAFSDDNGNDPKKAGIPKGDAAKEEAKKKEEQAGLDALLKTYGPDSLKRALWEFVKMDNPDGIFLRFLRARKWDVTRAMGMFASCLKWRLDNNVEELVIGGDLGNSEIEKFLEQQRSGKTYALGTAINEQPICYIHVKKHLTFGQPGSSMQKYVIYAMESFRLLMQPPQEKVILFFDLTGFGLKNMDWNCILFIVKCLEAFYPESLGILYIHNAPWIFSGIWKILGPLLDPVVRSKVAFTKNAKDVEDRVPPSRLIADLGGEIVTGFEFIEPKEGENDKHKDVQGREKAWKTYMDLADKFEDVTRKQIDANGKDQKIEEERNLIIKKLRVAQFEHVEPYHRGLTVYHRDNTIDGQGKATWIYKQKDGKTFRHVVGRKTCVATLKREIEEMEEGKSTKDVEAKTQKAIDDKDWVALYGDEEVAMEQEGCLDGSGKQASSSGQSQQKSASAQNGRQQQQYDEPEHDEQDDHDDNDEHDEHDDEENKGYIAAAAGGVAAAAGGAAAVATGAASTVGNTLSGAASAVTGYFTGGQQQEEHEDNQRSQRAPQSKATTPGDFYDAQNADTPTLHKALDADEHLSGVSNGSAYRNSSAPASKDTNGFIDYSARRRRQYDDEDGEEAQPAPRQQPAMRSSETRQPEKSASTGGIMSGLAGAGSAVAGGLASTLGYGNKNQEQDQYQEEHVPNGHAQANGRASRRSMNGSATDGALMNGSSRANGSINGSRTNGSARYIDEDDDYVYKATDYSEGRARSMRRKSQQQRMGDAYYGGSTRKLFSGPASNSASYRQKQEALTTDQGYGQEKGGVGRRLSGIFKKN